MSIKELFDAGAFEYDAGRRRVIYCFDDFYGTLLDLVPFAPGDSFTFLDLGAGTGLVTELILARHPLARADLLDVSEKMLEVARQRFHGRPKVRFFVEDYARADLPGRYGLIVSAMSIHHLADAGKQRLFQKIFAALDPGGAFVHGELVKGATANTEAFYQRRWNDHLQRAGIEPEELARIRQRMAGDRPAPLDYQLAWMRASGFVDVDCYYKYCNFAVYAGKKPVSA